MIGNYDIIDCMIELDLSKIPNFISTSFSGMDGRANEWIYERMYVQVDGLQIDGQTN